MKRLSIILLVLTLAAGGASAQKVIVGGRIGGYSHPYYYQPYVRPYYGFGLGLGFGYPYYGYPYYYNRPYYYRGGSGLDREINNIENDFADRIQSARMDNSLTGRERRQEIRHLREQRREAIDNARRNYYKQPYQYRGYNQNNSNNNNDQNSQQ